jgi:tetratricopeptide (TPR) repeat protein
MGSLCDVHQAASLLHALDPLSDTAVLALAEQHLLDGDSASAIRLLRTHIDLSEDELGRDPPRDLTLLLNRLERGSLSRPSLSGMPDIEDRPSLIRPEVFVGRENELSRLEATWTSACRGALTTCLISGSAGVGKSALVRRFATSVTARAWPAYVVVCQEIGSNIPFAAVSDLVYQLMRDPALGGTDPIWLAEASRVTPGLRAVYSGIPESPSTPPEAVRLRVAEALYRMLDTVTDGGPLLLVLDQFQNIDPASRDVLHVLKLRLEDTPTLMLATTRSNEAEFILTGPETVGGLDWMTCVELCALDTAQTLHLIADLLKQCDGMDGDVVQRVAELAQGNPYLVEMLVSDWRNNGPDSLVSREMGDVADATAWRPPQTMRLAFDRQYKGLTAAARRLIHLLAVAGRNVPVTELETILGVSSPALDLAALEVIDRAIIRTAGGALGFKNELHRAFVYWAMSQEARSYYHARLARCVPTAPDDDDFQRALEASHHYLKAGMDKEAIDTVCVGAELAITRGAPKEAEKALKAVINSGDCDSTLRPTVLLAAALSALQQHKRSLATLAAANIANCDARYGAMASSVRAEALHRSRLADPDTIARATDEAVNAASAVGEPRLIIEAQQVTAEVAFECGDWIKLSEVEHACAQVGREAVDVEIQALACLTLGYCRLVSGDFEGASENLVHSCRNLEASRYHTKLHWALNGLGICHTNLGHFQKATNTLLQAVSMAGQCGDTVSQAKAHANLGSLYYELGLFSKSADHFRRAAALDQERSNSRVTASIRCNAANLSIALGNFREATQLLDSAGAEAERSQLWQYSVNVLLTRADLDLASGTPELAWARVEEAVSLTGDRFHSLPDAGQYWRLSLHYDWATRGGPRPDAQSVSWRPPMIPRLSHRLEVRAFEEWMTRAQARGLRSARTAADQLAEHRLFGILARLASVGILFESLPAPLANESAAALITRAFPSQMAAEVPLAVGV